MSDWWLRNSGDQRRSRTAMIEAFRALARGLARAGKPDKAAQARAMADELEGSSRGGPQESDKPRTGTKDALCEPGCGGDLEEG